MKLIKNLSGHKHLFLGFALAWTFAVLILCLASFDNLPSIPVQDFDKIVHAAFHFGITTLWFLYWNSKENGQLRKSLLIAYLFSFVYGSLIEIMQFVFTATRSGDVLDMLSNVAGASIAALLILIIASIVKKPILKK